MWYTVGEDGDLLNLGEKKKKKKKKQTSDVVVRIPHLKNLASSQALDLLWFV